MIARLSLRARLLAITVALLVAGLAVISSVVVRQLETQLLARMDAQFSPLASALAALSPEVLAQWQQRAAAIPARLSVDEFALADKAYIAFLAADGTLVQKMGMGGEVALPRLDTAAVKARGSHPFTIDDATGERWRVLAVPSRAGEGVSPFLNLRQEASPSETPAEAPAEAPSEAPADAPGYATVAVAVSLEAMDSTVDRLRAASLVAGSLLLAVLAVVGGVAIRAGLAPLRRVEETAAAIAAGDLTRRVPEPAAPGTEVGRLTRSLNGMLTQIEQGFAAREESEARMRRFVADVSHELRTPLFGIKGFSELYRMGGTDAEAALARIESESGRLARLVDDLLLLAALDEPEGVAAALEPTPMDLRTLAADARHDFAALDPSRPITFTGPDGGPAASAPVLGDEARLRQVVSNLVGNAVTHTPAGTPVRIGVGTVGAEAVLVIEDSGPGLSAEEAARAFDRFYRADTSRARTTGGAGLGLAIVRSIVAAHGGRVEIRSTPGRGAAFQILLPAVTS
ncbi:ATP-binding protein [Nonomuraea sp. NPDC049714]|uniref:sensor histidine kinase n=1 Tax=Nonomuraea sp. NPDC049714 TaxID=3364357 RepID=UPI0037926F9B